MLDLSRKFLLIVTCNQSPIDLVPKAGNKTRLIFHLSYDFNDEDRSLNYHTPEEMCTVK